MSAIFTDSSGPAMGLALKLSRVHIAWGNGSPAWDSTPVSPPSDATALVAEVGRRAANTIIFVTPDAGGEIQVNDGNYSQSSSPTRYLYVLASFDNADGAGESIREAAVFVGTVIKNTVPVDQHYFEPADIQDGGVLLLLDRFTKDIRTVDFRVNIAFVISF